MKNPIQSITRIVAGLVLTAMLLTTARTNAQVVVGSWQGTGSALSTAGDEGWIDWGDQLSITNPANASVYSFASDVVAGYEQSLQITEAGDNENLCMKLENLPGGMAAFLTNGLLTFTFSVPPGTSTSEGGYVRLDAVIINASGYGYNSQSFANLSATGDTSNNGVYNGGPQPIFYFYNGGPAQSQTITLNYSSILPSITSTGTNGYIEIIFIFGAANNSPNYYMNNVLLSSLPANPTLSLQKATPSLRIFAGSTVNTYDREELTTVNQKQSWIGGAYPVSYSFTLLDSAACNGFQTHMFLIPVNSANAAVSGNEYLDYNASNSVWLQINGASSGPITANISWKTNSPNANPNNVAVNITNATAVGTWTVTFTNASGGILTAPGANPLPFTINDPNVASDFGNPCLAIFGLQPQSTGGYGLYDDYANISITNVVGGNLNENFTTEPSISANWDLSNSAQQSSLVLATTNTPYWISWTLPGAGVDADFGLGVAPDLTSGNWHLPEYYNYYGDGNNLPGLAKQGYLMWVLIPNSTLPTVDASQGGSFHPQASMNFSIRRWRIDQAPACLRKKRRRLSDAVFTSQWRWKLGT